MQQIQIGYPNILIMMGLVDEVSYKTKVALGCSHQSFDFLRVVLRLWDLITGILPSNSSGFEPGILPRPHLVKPGVYCLNMSVLLLPPIAVYLLSF